MAAKAVEKAAPKKWLGLFSFDSESKPAAKKVEVKKAAAPAAKKVEVKKPAAPAAKKAEVKKVAAKAKPAAKK